MIDNNYIYRSLKQVANSKALVHCITNYVTVNDCANILLAFGGSPVMADCPDEVQEITSISSGLNINIGTLNHMSIEAAIIAGKRANELGIPVTLDPVGVGASSLRTKTALNLLNTIKFSAIRGNISEIKTLIYGTGSTYGVDASNSDPINDSNWRKYGLLLQQFSKTLGGTVVAASGPIDVVANHERICGVFNGTAMMSQITGCGCMLTSVVSLWLASCRPSTNIFHDFETTVSAISAFGVCGEIAYDKTIRANGGTGMFHCNLIDVASTTPRNEIAVRSKFQLL